MANLQRKTKNNPKTPRQSKVDDSVLHGIEKVAFWSVPAVVLVAMMCGSFLGYKLFNQPAIVVQVVDLAGRELRHESVTKQTTVVAVENENSKVAARVPSSTFNMNALNAKPAKTPAKVTKVTGQSGQAKSTTVISLLCKDDGIEYLGDGQINFFPKAPTLELIESEGVTAASIAFNGENQSIELPSISKNEGSISIVIKMPTSETSIFLDSSSQRLTLRKNRDGLRWRVAGMKKPAKIRLVQRRVDFRKWHHLVVSWKTGNQAMLYVDGVLADQYAYINENQSPTFDKIVLGRTRGPNSKFYNCNVAEFKGMNFAMNQSEVEELHQLALDSYPHFLTAK